MNSKIVKSYIESRDLQQAVARAEEQLKKYMASTTDEACKFAAQNAINALHDFELVKRTSKSKDKGGRDF